MNPSRSMIVCTGNIVEETRNKLTVHFTTLNIVAIDWKLVPLEAGSPLFLPKQILFRFLVVRPITSSSRVQFGRKTRESPSLDYCFL
jgi:hypothetical protein